MLHTLAYSISRDQVPKILEERVQSKVGQMDHHNIVAW